MRNLPANPLERQLAPRGHVSPGYIDTDAYDSSKQDDALRTYLNILRRRKWYIIIPVVVIACFSLLTLAVEDPLYWTSSRILIENDRPQVLQIQDLQVDDKSDQFYMTEYDLIKTSENLYEVIDILKLDKKAQKEENKLKTTINNMIRFPRRVMGRLKNNIMAIIAPLEEKTVGETVIDKTAIRRIELRSELYEALEVTPVLGTKLVDVSATGPDPQEITHWVNTLVAVYLRKNLEKKLEESRKAIAWLSQKAAELKQKMYKSELALQAFREKNGIISLDFAEKRNLIHERLENVHVEYMRANAEREDFETRLNKIKNLSADSLERIENLTLINNDPVVSSLRQKYVDRLNEYRSLTKVFRPRHPRMLQLRSEINETKQALNRELRKLVGALQAEYNMRQARELTLARELKAQKEATLRLSSNMITYESMKGEVTSQQNLYQEAAKRLQEIKLTQALIKNNVKVVEPAIVPLEPMASKKMMKLFLSLVLGCTFGVGLAFVREYFDNRFKDVDEVEHYLHLPLLGFIPHSLSSRPDETMPVSQNDSRSHAAEAYRILRTRIIALAPGLKTLFVTSAVPGEGKSTTTVNLGIAFAQLGRQVLLVDTDLRRPKLHRHFQLMNDRGMTTVLKQEKAWQECLQNTSLLNLKALTAGPITHNPSDLLGLHVIKQLFEDFENTFDLVLVDSPITLSLPDVEILAPYMDGVILVHTPGHCPKKSVWEAKKRLDWVGANILGLVLNNIKSDYKNYNYSYHSYHSDYYETNI